MPYGVSTRRYAIGGLALALIAGSAIRLRTMNARVDILEDLASPYRWCDAGDAYEERGEDGKAVRAYDRALQLSADDAAILLRAANFQLTRNDARAAFPKFSRLLRIAPDFAPTVFGTYLGMNFSVRDVLAYGLPKNRGGGEAYFEWLLTQKVQPERAAVAWSWLLSRGFANNRLAERYTTYLFQAGQFESAALAWAEVEGPNLGFDRVYDGGFERDPLRSPLDWFIESALAERDLGVAQAGRSSLRINFSGLDNIEFQHVRQDLVVTPGLYRFGAFVKTANLTTDQGIVFHIFDPEQPARLNLWTDQFTGTRDWTETGKSIRVLAGTRLLRVQISRRQSRKFDGKVAGTAWIDSVSLVPAAS